MKENNFAILKKNKIRYIHLPIKVYKYNHSYHKRILAE